MAWLRFKFVFGSLFRKTIPLRFHIHRYLTDLAAQVLIHSLTLPGDAAGRTSASASMADRGKIAQAIIDSCLPRVLGCCRSPLLQGGALGSILDFFNTLSFMFPAGSGGGDVGSKLIEQLLDVSALQRVVGTPGCRTVLATLAKCVASLAVVAGASESDRVVQGFVPILREAVANKQQLAQDRAACTRVELALLSLGEIGKWLKWLEAETISMPGLCASSVNAVTLVNAVPTPPVPQTNYGHLNNVKISQGATSTWRRPLRGPTRG